MVKSRRDGGLTRRGLGATMGGRPEAESPAVSQPPIHPNLPLLLAQAREEIISRFRPILNHFGVTEQQWRILRELRQAEPMEPNQICETCMFLSPSLAGVLARMVELDLVRKERMTSDHRRVLVHMTDKSRALVDAALPLILEQYRHMDAAIGAEQTEQLYGLLSRLLALRGAAIPLVKLPP
jgi:homoprotocatechuate degradation regulator HpaR